MLKCNQLTALPFKGLTLNFVFAMQALWLPGSQTEVAVVTADFVKVYNLSVDAISPQYYFLLPTGKIRDATLVVSDSERHLVLMASSGYIYTQVMDVTSSAQHGPFYITNILEMKHADVKVHNILSLNRPIGGAEYCDQPICLSVCLCVCFSLIISLEPLDRSAQHFVCRSPVAVARLSSAGVALRYVLRFYG